MADESMVRNLEHQAAALWPQEEPIFRTHGVGPAARILDAGCGTAEIASRLARMWPDSHVVGIDLIESHLDLARRRYADLAPRLELRRADALHLPFEDRSFDLVVSRHVIQAVPDPAIALAELVRVTKRGGRLHVIAEDYGMIWMHPTRLGAEKFWGTAPEAFGRTVGCDLFVGRKIFTLLRALPVDEIEVRHLAVDTQRVPRETFAGIWEAWKDGYRSGIAEATTWPIERITAHFDDMIDCIRNPDGYALWLVPLATATRR